MERSDTMIQTGPGGHAGQQGADRFGMSNLEYDIVVTLSNLLEGQEALMRYAADADQAGDGECATIFRTLQDNNRATVQQLRNALGRHISGTTAGR
jgi:hypothetical protein